MEIDIIRLLNVHDSIDNSVDKGVGEILAQFSSEGRSADINEERAINVLVELKSLEELEGEFLCDFKAFGDNTGMKTL